MKFTELKGYLLAAIAAAAYGTNPAFAIPLYEQGMNPNSVLLFRYMMGFSSCHCDGGEEGDVQSFKGGSGVDSYFRSAYGSFVARPVREL